MKKSMKEDKITRDYEKWNKFDDIEALRDLENEDKPEEPNLSLESGVDKKTGQRSVHVNCVDYKKSKEEVKLDEELKVGARNLQGRVLQSADMATKCKLEGNRYFKAKDYENALKEYSAGISQMQTASMALTLMSGRLSHRITNLLIDLHNNASMVRVFLNSTSHTTTTTTIFTHIHRHL
jgi:hypothetical protein